MGSSVVVPLGVSPRKVSHEERTPQRDQEPLCVVHVSLQALHRPGGSLHCWQVQILPSGLLNLSRKHVQQGRCQELHQLPCWPVLQTWSWGMYQVPRWTVQRKG